MKKNWCFRLLKCFKADKQISPAPTISPKSTTVVRGTSTIEETLTVRKSIEGRRKYKPKAKNKTTYEQVPQGPVIIERALGFAATVEFSRVHMSLRQSNSFDIMKSPSESLSLTV